MKPALVFSNKLLEPLLKKVLSRKGGVILTDPYNFTVASRYGETILVRDNDANQLENLRSRLPTNVIALGGCTVLDIARAACGAGQHLTLIPTILSTACISVNKAIIRLDGQNRAISTEVPNRVIVSIPLLMSTNSAYLNKWSQSGFADLFARFGAAIDLSYARRDFSQDSILRNVAECRDAINWVISSFTSFDRSTLRRLAILLHNASLDVINGDVGVGGEHSLYYIMVEQQKDYTNERPTHGQLVGIGTLLEAKLFGEWRNDFTLYNMLRTAYQKLGIPLDRTGLAAIGIELEHLMIGLVELGKRDEDRGSILHDHSKRAIHLLDDVFSNA